MLWDFPNPKSSGIHIQEMLHFIQNDFLPIQKLEKSYNYVLVLFDSSMF